MEVKQVLIDTNFFLIPYQHNIDIFTEIERLVPENHTLITFNTVLTELEKLTGVGKDAIAAKIGLKLIEEKKVLILPSEGNVDDMIIKYSEKPDVIVATNDREMKDKLKKQGVEILVMRGKKQLERQ